MKATIRTKLLTLCILLILLTSLGISATYYVLIKQDKHRESRQRIQLAFDLVLHDFEKQVSTLTKRFGEFLQKDYTIKWAIESYNDDATQIISESFIVSSLVRSANNLKEFGNVISATRLSLYAADKRLMAVYQQDDDGQESVGIYVVSPTQHDTYLSAGNPEQLLNSIVARSQAIPDNPLPSEIAASYKEEIPDTIRAVPFKRAFRFGIRITAPIVQDQKNIGILVGEILYTHEMVEQYASLSKIAINFFCGNPIKCRNSS